MNRLSAQRIVLFGVESHSTIHPEVTSLVLALDDAIELLAFRTRCAAGGCEATGFVLGECLAVMQLLGCNTVAFLGCHADPLRVLVMLGWM